MKMLLQVVTATNFILAVVVILILWLCLRGPFSEAPVFYPDLITQDASTCWEATVFATTSDPIYKWVQSSSLANAFNLTIDAERATAAYQRATIWKTISKERGKSASDIKLFSSPDVRMLGGFITPERTNWIWKMRISWGMSVRVCLTGPNNAVTCTWTAPVVYNTNDTLGVIMVKVPYGMPAEDPFIKGFPSYGDHGYFLMNFAGNARKNISLGVGRKSAPAYNHSDHDDRHWFRYQVAMAECSKAVPLMVVPDIVSYMAYPFMQCACRTRPSTRVCWIGVNITQKSESAKGFEPGFVFSDESCGSTRSLWFWDLRQTSLPDNRSSIPFSSYNPKLDTLALFSATFKYEALPNFNDTTIGLMNNLTRCVEEWLEKQESKPRDEDSQRLLDDCSRGVSELVEVGSLFSRLFNKVPQLNMEPEDIREIVYARVSSRRDANNVTCGIEEGQTASELDICFLEYSLPGLEDQLDSFAKVTDIRRFGSQLWEKGSSRRSEVYFGILTTLVSLALAIAGSFSNQLQEGEEFVFQHAHCLKNAIKVPALRTLFRAGMILVTTGSSMYPLYQSIKGIEMESTEATSGSIPQQSNTDVVFVVTTTSTVEVVPNWIVFYAFTVILVACMFTVVAFIFKYMVRESSIEPEALYKDK